MEKRYRERMIDLLLCTVLGGAAIYLGVRFLLPVLLPFLLALGIAAAIMPAAERVAKRSGIPKRICAVVFFFLLLAALTLIVGWSVSRLLREAGELLGRLLSEYGSFDGAVNAALSYLESVLVRTGLFSEGSGELRERLYRMLGEALPTMLSTVASWISSFAGGLIRAFPDFLLATVVTVIAGFYLCFDREGIAQGVRAALPDGIKRRMTEWKRRMRHLSLRYLRAYFLLLLITLVLLLVGFWILGVRYAFLTASVTAVVDFLPVLGIGTVLLPWAAVVLIQGNYYLGFGLLILYGSAMLLRQILEPRLVGKSLGMHPLLTVVATYTGWKLFGVIGMIIAPFAAVLFKGILRRE